MLIYDDYKENYYISKALLIESNQFMKNIMNLGKKKKKKKIKKKIKKLGKKKKKKNIYIE